MNELAPATNTKDVYGVFEGGGVRCAALIGAVSAIQEEGIEFRAVAGTSAGAIVAALIAAGYTASEMYEILLNKDFKDFKDPVSRTPLYKWVVAYKNMGIYRGDEFRRWINELLEKKLGKIQPRMMDLPKPLMVVATNLFHRRIDWFKGPKAVVSAQYLELPIADAVRASMSIPGFFVPHKCSGATFVDGGVLSNFPAFAFKDEGAKDPLPVLGFRLDSGDTTAEVGNTLQLITSLIDTVITHNSSNQLPEDSTIRLNTFDVAATDFDITTQRKKELYDFAKMSTRAWLATHDIALPSESLAQEPKSEAVTQS